jgi:hypothetical protein
MVAAAMGIATKGIEVVAEGDIALRNPPRVETN